MSFGFVTEFVSEGEVQIIVPKLKAFKRTMGDYAPSRAPVFYNPLMEISRDMAILVLQAYQRSIGRGLSVSEPLAGCGVKGIRFAKEVEGIEEIHLNDINPEAFRMMKHNIQLNELVRKISSTDEDAKLFLSHYARPKIRFDYIDIDPSGTPVPYLDSSIQALRNGGMLALTATDLAPLCGVYPTVALRKYGGFSLRTEYCRELAVRLLTSCLVTTAARHNIGIRVVFSHNGSHYVRVYALASYNAKEADKSVRKLGYVLHCFECFHREIVFGVIPHLIERCFKCGSPLKVAGPLWLGELSDVQFCEHIKKEIITRRLKNTHRIENILSLIITESDMPVTYYVVDSICDKFNVCIPSLKSVLRHLNEMGFRAETTHFHSRGIKTNAPAEVVIEAITRISK